MAILVAALVTLTFLASALAVGPGLIVEWAQRRSPDVVFHVETAEPVIALTIDDGPSPATPEILDVLDELGIRATFFVIGKHVKEHPELARRIVADGHELGHHMMVDEPSIDLSPDTFRARFQEMDSILGRLGGSRVFRPASGWYDGRMIQVAAGFGYRTVLGSVYPFDAQLPFPAVASWYVRWHAEPGAVLVLHDGPGRGRRTADVLRQVLPRLLARGYRVVPVSALVGSTPPTEIAHTSMYGFPIASSR